MKITSTVLLSGLLAVAVQAAPQPQASQSPEQQCLNKCNLGDVTCQAACVSVPAPNESMANNTTNCAAHCNQGSGSPEDTVAYGKCVQGCISSYFYGSAVAAATPAPGGTTGATGAAGTVAATATAAASSAGSKVSSAAANASASATGAAASASHSGSAAASAASASASAGAASSNMVGASFAGVAGIMAAIFAL